MSNTAYFESCLNSFVSGCNEIVKAADLTIPFEVRLGGGRKYVRLLTFEQNRYNGEWEPNSAFAFVNKENGDVLRAASHSKPSSHVCGNIFAPDNGLGCINWTGPIYIR